ncbi:MAG: hypothetical protein F4Z12_09545 [Acidobacteria bacterium]|nr:hypothetical protein [Acidobacteriota bacterium]MYE68894.1 hypothetical protein [Gemmatimonadota bacterium]MYI96320.1 hypothetical protein [Acidobacteriota bacterium]
MTNHSSAVSAHDVELPRIGAWKVIHENDEWSVALCTIQEPDRKGRTRVGIRWNGGAGADSLLGYPNVRGYPCWFVLPDELGATVRCLVEHGSVVLPPICCHGEEAGVPG